MSWEKTDVSSQNNNCSTTYPIVIRFITRSVTEIVKGEYIRGYKNITFNEEMFSGHFGQPIMPGVLILGHGTDCAGVRNYGSRPADGRNYLFGGVDKARFRRPVVPGDKLELHSRLIAKRAMMVKFECEAMVDGELAASQYPLLSRLLKG